MRPARPVSLFVVLVFLASGACGRKPPAADGDSVAVWKPLGTWSGRGSTQLEAFPIERFTWRMRWETKNESPQGSGTFRVTANSGESGRVVADVVDVKGVDRDIAYVSDTPRSYYLVVTSSGVDWSVTVEEERILR